MLPASGGGRAAAGITHQHWRNLLTVRTPPANSLFSAKHSAAGAVLDKMRMPVTAPRGDRSIILITRLQSA